MIDIKLLRSDPEMIRNGADAKGIDVDTDALLALDEKVRALKSEEQKLRHQQREAGSKIAKAKGEQKQQLIADMKGVSERVRAVSGELDEVETELGEALRLVPNPALPGVSIGESEEENVVVREVPGTCPKMDFEPKHYMDLAEVCDIIDTQRAAKVAGTRFGYLKNEGALMEFALVQLAVNTLMPEGFVPVVPPVMIRHEPMDAMGYLTRGLDEVYRTQDDLYLVGTSEQSTGPLHMDEILDEDELPKRYVAFSTCFRREAGAHGKDTRGILRVHQFDKAEMFVFSHPDRSCEEHDGILALEEKLVSMLGLPYRVVQMCTGDLGDPAANKRDIECWMPGQDQYRETHSCSNCTDYQARSLNVRFREKDGGEIRFVHTLNGTAYAIGRTIIAIIENYQRADGSIEIPEALRPYMGGREIIQPRNGD